MKKDEKRITIKFPSFGLSSFLSARFFLVLSVLIFSCLFGFWYKTKRPYLKIKSARLEAFSTTIHSDSPGRISLMGPQEGDFVKKGERLFTLENERLLSKRFHTKQTLDSLVKQMEFEKARVETAMQAYLTATNDLDSIAPDSVQKHLDQMDGSQTKAEAAAQEVIKAKTELDLIDQEFKKLIFCAPFTGTILKRAKNPGSVISFGDPLYVLCDTGNLWIDTEIDEKDLESVSIGTPARIQLTAYPKKEFKGQVTYIGPATVAKSSVATVSCEKQTIPIKISIETQNLLLKPGLSASVDLKVR